MSSFYAPSKRTDRRKFRNQIADISKSPLMDALLRTAAGMLVVLNEDRQIVAINHSFLDELGIANIHDVLGMRLGESLSCIHAFKEPHGCGTTLACQSCGAAIAMMTAITDNLIDEQTCAITTERDGRFSDICLRIKAQPLDIENNRWILIYAQDITQQKFWINLERIFFHDISNTITSIYGKAQLLKLDKGSEKNLADLETSIERLIQEVSIQKAFSAQKQQVLLVDKKPVLLEHIQREVRLIIKGHKSVHISRLIESWPKTEETIKTDPLLVSRILANMIINGFEAANKEENIRLEALSTDNHVSWNVYNQAFIPPSIQPRIFQKNYSSKKGSERGLGTYSMKLLGEKYLGGKVSFVSSKNDGTCFTLTLPK